MTRSWLYLAAWNDRDWDEQTIAELGPLRQRNSTEGMRLRRGRVPGGLAVLQIADIFSLVQVRTGNRGHGTPAPDGFDALLKFFLQSERIQVMLQKTRFACTLVLGAALLSASARAGDLT